MSPTEAFAAILNGTAPSGLRVEGSLILNNCRSLTALPDGLHVSEWLCIADCTSLTALPESLRVDGYLNISPHASLTALPDDKSGPIGCAALTALPEGLRVDGYLYLTGCTALIALPENMYVGGSLYLNGCAGLIGARWRGGVLSEVNGMVALVEGAQQEDDWNIKEARWLRNIAPNQPLPHCQIAERNGVAVIADTVAAAKAAWTPDGAKIDPAAVLRTPILKDKRTAFDA